MTTAIAVFPLKWRWITRAHYFNIEKSRLTLVVFVVYNGLTRLAAEM